MIFLDLPLSDPYTAEASGIVENLHFFFAGIIPEIDHQGDHIRFLYHHGVRIDADAYVRVSDFSNELFDYVIREWEQMAV